MGFVLRITQGAGEGEEYSLAGEARLGRTADNDIVIKDPSSSRSHCRVFEKNGKCWVEDLESANGTELNGVPLKAPKPLKDGDEVAIGDVVLRFEGAAPEGGKASDTLLGQQVASSTIDESDLASADPNATNLRPSRPAAASVRPSRKSAVPPPARRLASRASPVPAPEPEPEPDEEEAPEPEPEEEEASAEEGPSTRAYDVPPPRAMARRSNAAAVRPSRGGGEAPSEMTAAERARERRELQRSFGGRMQLMWQDMSGVGRAALGLVLAVFAAGFLGGVGYLLMPKNVHRKPEVFELKPNAEPLPDSFGLGDDVDYRQSDQKSFTFTYNSPTKVVGVLHFQAKNISKGEVSLELNGAELGAVQPDTLEADTREQEVVMPTNSVKVGEPNTLVFDNVNNPPGDDPWKIWNVWVEVNPIPEMSSEEATRRAKEDIEKATKYYELRDVGASNLFRAWKTYRDAWLVLESTPEASQSTKEVARTRMREIRPELDKRCAAMFVEFKKVINQRVPDLVKARKILEDIPTYFPTREHPCNSFAHAAIASLEEVPPEEPK